MKRLLPAVLLALLTASPGLGTAGHDGAAGQGARSRRAAVLPGVTVTVKNQATGMYRETVSGDDGSFIASGLVAGHRTKSPPSSRATRNSTAATCSSKSARRRRST